MNPYFLEKFGNPASSSHSYGWEANEAVEMARESIAKSIGATDKKEIIFTSGATESNNLVVKGITGGANGKIHVITQKTEHKCVLDSCLEIQKKGHEVTFLDVDESGKISPEQVKSAIRDNTLLCSIMYANNEIGTVQSIREIAEICRSRGVLLHTDAVQAVGKIPIDVSRENIDLMSLSGHKMYGPKGIGALYLSKKNPSTLLAPLLHGGGHEKGLRSGTLNVPAIVGMANALELCFAEMESEGLRLKSLRDYLWKSLADRVGGVTLNGHPTDRLPNNLNISIEGMKADDLISAVPQLAMATGSACSSGLAEPSYVMQAITNDKNRISSAIRIGLGRWTTAEEVEKTVECIVSAVSKLRAKSDFYIPPPLTGGRLQSSRHLGRQWRCSGG